MRHPDRLHSCVANVPAILYRRSPLRLQKNDKQAARLSNKISTGSNERLE
ncbi:hypothetical protein [Prevotella corporis]|nr:hypothetical protein [Prevotella corporis]